MDEEIQKPEPKISDVEIILIGVFYLGLDAIDLIPAAGDITDVIAAPMGFYYWMKGLNGTAFLASEAIEAIPGAQEIPFVRTITWGINIWLDRHPKLQATFATVEAVGGAVGGATEGISNSESVATEVAGGTVATAGGEVGQGDMAQAAESGRPSDQSTERDLSKNETEGEREADREHGVRSGGEASEEPDLEAGPENKSDEERLEDEKKAEAEKELRQGAEILPEEEAIKADFPEAETLQTRRQPPQEQNAAQQELDERYAREQAKFGDGRPQKGGQDDAPERRAA